MSTLCFEKAGNTMWEKLAKASSLRASADQMWVTNHDAFVSYAREAGEMFESIGKLESAASCYCDLGDYERAGNFFLAHESSFANLLLALFDTEFGSKSHKFDPYT